MLPSTISLSDKIPLEHLMHDLTYHDYRYYVLDSPIISDYEYDKLFSKYQEFREKYPELPERVGMTSDRYNVLHINKMLSMRSVKTIVEATALFSKYQGMMLGEPKIDGLAIELVYRNHHLVEASTRGDGSNGESVLDNVINIKDIPKLIGDGSDIEIYGEIYLSKIEFERINHSMISTRKRPYDNARNAAAGIVRSKSKEKKKLVEFLGFLPYRLEGALLSSQLECYNWLQDQGFTTFTSFVTYTISDMEDVWKQMSEMRDSWEYDIDGVVFKVDSIIDQEEIGYGNRHPNWAIAIKFPPKEAESRLNEVIFQVGKSGIIAPVGLINPIKINGVTISRVSLANINKIREKDIRINDIIRMSRSNDVIPHANGVVIEDRNGKEIPIEFPNTCPVCNQNLIFISPHYICKNPDCHGQVLGKIVSGTSRKGFYVENLGPKRIAELLDNEIIKDLSDIFLLDSDEKQRLLKEVLGYQDKTLENIKNSVIKSRTIDLSKFIRALSIPNVSIAISTRLAEYYGSLDNLINRLSHEPIVKLSDISGETLQTAETWFRTNENLELIQRLIDRGVDVKTYKYLTTNTDQPLVVMTGEFSIPREEIRSKLLLNGYRVGSDVTSKTNYLLVGENPGSSKLRKAIDKGTKQITLKELLPEF